MIDSLIKLITLLCLLVVNFSLALTPIRVLLDSVSGPIDYHMTGAHQGYVDGNLLFSTNLGISWPISVQGNELHIDETAIGKSLRLEPLNDNFISWQGRSYRGNLNLVATDNKLQVINTVDLEDYLRGVIPAEMQASWNIAALKAQVVAARTYTLASLNPEAAYDVCATTECQVYEGMNIEHRSSDQAIRETIGMVLTYGDTFAYTYYHADSGGEIASSLEVWGFDVPYLNVKEDYVQNSPNANWTFNLEPNNVLKVLRAYGYNLDKVKAVNIIEKSNSGRVSKLEIKGSANNLQLEGTVLHKIVRDWGLKSTHFDVVGNLLIRGEGWGHGVGMSQYGARTLAEHDYNYQQILDFYYPGTVLRQLQSEEVAFYQP